MMLISGLKIASIMMKAHSFDMITPEGKFPVTMQLLGEFNVYNVLAAAAVLYARGYPIEHHHRAN